MQRASLLNDLFELRSPLLSSFPPFPLTLSRQLPAVAGAPSAARRAGQAVRHPPLPCDPPFPLQLPAFSATAELLAELLCLLARQAPRVAILEDSQWADRVGGGSSSSTPAPPSFVTPRVQDTWEFVTQLVAKPVP